MTTSWIMTHNWPRCFLLTLLRPDYFLKFISETEQTWLKKLFPYWSVLNQSVSSSVKWHHSKSSFTRFNLKTLKINSLFINNQSKNLLPWQQCQSSAIVVFHYKTWSMIWELIRNIYSKDAAGGSGATEAQKDKPNTSLTTRWHSVPHRGTSNLKHVTESLYVTSHVCDGDQNINFFSRWTTRGNQRWTCSTWTHLGTEAWRGQI